MTKSAPNTRLTMESLPVHSAGPTIYYDGGCPVCSREIAVYQRQAGAETCTWVDASRCDESELGVDLTRAAAMQRLHVRQADGRLVNGARGFAAIWSALPRTAWLGRLATLPPVNVLLEAGYRGFLGLRRLWRPPAPAARQQTPAWPDTITADLRSDHAGEVGAIQIYRGAMAMARSPALRAFAADHLATESQHLQCIERHLPAHARSRLLPAWRVAGWLTGALPALLGPRMFHATVAAVETFVDRHYAEQIDRIDRALQAVPPPPGARRLGELRADLQACREDEVRHRDEALAAGAATGLLVRCWAAAVSAGSGTAVALARRI